MRPLGKLATALVVSLVLAGIFYFKFFGAGIPHTHDGPQLLVRKVNYALALRQGQIPPRIGPNLANGFGYPVFNYNYPFANIMAAPLFALRLPAEAVFQLVVAALLVIGGMGWWRLTYEHTKSRAAAILGTGLYMANPFTIQLVFVRGGTGELAATAILPWLLLAMHHAFKKSGLNNFIWLGLVGAVFILTHNTLVMLAALPLGIYGLLLLKQKPRLLPKTLLAVTIALGLSSFFWLPALGEKPLVVLDSSTINKEYIDHFVYPVQLIRGEWGFGFSYPGPEDELSFRFSWAELAGLTLALFWGLVNFKSQKRLLGLIAVTVFSALVSTYLFRPLWAMTSLSEYVQFPWRVLWISHLLAIGTIAYWVSLQKMRIVWTMLILVLAGVDMLPKAFPADRHARDRDSWILATETTSTMNENSPKTFDLYRAYEIKDEVFGEQLVLTEPEGAVVSIDHWDGSKRRYRVTTEVPIEVIERTAYFPGWEVYANGEKLTVTADDPWKAGLSTYQLPPGDYEIRSYFSQNTIYRKIGNGLSAAFSAGLFIYGAAWIIVHIGKRKK
jgi:hypothetical protein